MTLPGPGPGLIMRPVDGDTSGVMISGSAMSEETTAPTRRGSLSNRRRDINISRGTSLTKIRSAIFSFLDSVTRSRPVRIDCGLPNALSVGVNVWQTATLRVGNSETQAKE